MKDMAKKADHPEVGVRRRPIQARVTFTNIKRRE